MLAYYASTYFINILLLNSELLAVVMLFNSLPVTTTLQPIVVWGSPAWISAVP